MRKQGVWPTKQWLEGGWLRVERAQQGLSRPSLLCRSTSATENRVEERLQIPERARVEAALIMAKSPLTPRRLSQMAFLEDATQARTVVQGLNEAYDREGRAFRVEDIAGGYVLMTRAELAPWLRRLPHLPQPERLTQPALETLSVVAYRQPVQRADVEAVRGVSCGEILRQLMEKGLVKISGRSEDLGRPYLYSTTKRFLQIFGLRSTDNLPHADWFQERATESESRSDFNGDPPSSELHPDNVEKEADVSVQLANEALPTDQELGPTIPLPGVAAAADSSSPVAVIEDDEDEFLDEEDEDFDDEDDDDEYDEEYDEEEYDDEEEDDDFDEEENDWEEVDDDDEEDEDWDEEEDLDADDDEEEDDDELFDDADVEEDEWD